MEQEGNMNMKRNRGFKAKPGQAGGGLPQGLERALGGLVFAICHLPFAIPFAPIINLC
jgi:hypothetical protein